MSTPIVVGIAGYKGAGKSTLANYLADRGFVVLAFADPVYEALSSIFEVPRGVLEDQSTKKMQMDALLGVSPRYALQTLGTEWGRDFIHPDIWVELCMRRVQKLLNHGCSVVVSDVRFDNEATALRSIGGYIVEVKREGCAPPPKTFLQKVLSLIGIQSGHRSDAGVSTNLVDADIYNYSGKHRLDDMAALVIKEATLRKEQDGSRPYKGPSI